MIDGDRIKIDEATGKALDARWQALEEAKDAVLFAQSDFDAAAFNVHKAEGTSPRHWAVIKQPDGWQLFKPENPPSPRGEE